MATLHNNSFGSVFPTAFAHFHVSVSHFDNSRDISNFFIIIVCHGELCSVIFDVTVVIVLGHHQLSPRDG